MNKSYLLVFCLLLTPFTGCIETEELNDSDDKLAKIKCAPNCSYEDLSEMDLSGIDFSES